MQYLPVDCVFSVMTIPFSFITAFGLSFSLTVFAADTASVPPPPAVPDSYNYIIGTQAIGGLYQFTSDTRLVESAKRIQELGSNIMKFTLSPEEAFGKEKGNVPERNPMVHSLLDLVTLEPSHKAVLEMPFRFYFLWAYPFGTKTRAGEFSPEDQEREYREMYDLSCHLLLAYSGTGKNFYLGHWEGDWHLRPHYDPKKPFPDGAGERFTRWLQVRQKAVDDAKRDTPHQQVGLWHYTEVNLVEPFLKGGQCLTNDILPRVDIDYVSYSSYDSLQHDIREGLFASLNHIESKLRPRAGIEGKRVFIGEYGFPTRRYSPEVQNEKTIETMRAALEWGCPFALYWELYSNEMIEGKLGGFWLIDDKGVKQPVYHTHEKFYQWARHYVEEATHKTGKAPSNESFRQEALRFLDSISGAH